jgi:hypothetical protein
MTVKMTREQFDRINIEATSGSFDIAIAFTKSATWGSKDNSCLNKLTMEEFATAWIAPEKVEIIEPEITWQEAIQILLDGGEVESFDVKTSVQYTFVISSNDPISTYFLDRIKTGKWRKVVSK